MGMSSNTADVLIGMIQTLFWMTKADRLELKMGYIKLVLDHEASNIRDMKRNRRGFVFISSNKCLCVAG